MLGFSRDSGGWDIGGSGGGGTSRDDEASSLEYPKEHDVSVLGRPPHILAY